MVALRIDDFRQYSDVLRSRDGSTVTVRFMEPRDREELQNYIRALSSRSRYSRFLGATSELPNSVLDHFVQIGEEDEFTVLATMPFDGFDSIVGEARYALHHETEAVEFGLSIDDRWQGHGIGAALLRNLECRAAALGAERIFGDTLRSNDAMIRLARKAGFTLTRHPDDWRLVRFEKQIDAAPKDIPCASSRLAAASRQLTNAAAHAN